MMSTNNVWGDLTDIQLGKFVICATDCPMPLQTKNVYMNRAILKIPSWYLGQVTGGDRGAEFLVFDLWIL